MIDDIQLSVNQDTVTDQAPHPVIDVHTHIYPRSYLELLAQREAAPRVERRDGHELLHVFDGESGRVLDEEYWSVEAKLAFMERSGIDQSVVSLGNPWLEAFEPADSVAIAKDLNAELAAMAADTGGRMVGMGCLPSGDVDQIATTIADVAGTEGLYGVVSGTRLAGMQFDDTGLDPVWSALAETRTPLLVHPHFGLGLESMDGFGHSLPLALAFTFETTTALSRLAMSGVLDRHPDLCVIGSHGGGTIPYLAGRLDGCWAPDESARARRQLPPSSALSRRYLDALVYHPRALRAVADLVSPQRMVFGTDHPFAIADPEVNIRSIRETFGENEAQDVFSITAQRLFSLPDIT
jgi:predicted TIM-barrel fold metal-dependent hydrolase